MRLDDFDGNTQWVNPRHVHAANTAHRERPYPASFTERTWRTCWIAWPLYPSVSVIILCDRKGNELAYVPDTIGNRTIIEHHFADLAHAHTLQIANATP